MPSMDLSDQKGTSGEERSCSICNTTKTPLWRGGPSGPKSLCNACGIKYRKKRREALGLESRSGSVNGTGTGTGAGGVKKEKNNKRREDDDDDEKKKKSSSTSIKLNMGMVGLEGKVVINKKKRKMMMKMGEEERAAILLMALSSSRCVHA